MMREARPAARWEHRPALTLDRQLRLLYRHLASHWGLSRDELRIVSVPVLLWLTSCVALAGRESVTVLARGRPDRRVQLYHANRDQMVTFSAGRLEADVAAPWTNPLRQVLFEWLGRGGMVTGIDASLVCTGPEAWHTAEVEAMACALGCHVGVWTELAGEGDSPIPFWPVSVEWPAQLTPFAQAFRALATVPAQEAAMAEGGPCGGRPLHGGSDEESLTQGDGGWVWVILAPSGPAVFAASGVRCLEAAGHEGVPPRRGAFPLWALPPIFEKAEGAPGEHAAADGADTEAAAGRMAAALARGDAPLIREAIAELAGLAGRARGQAPTGWLVLDETAEGISTGALRFHRAGAPRPLLCRKPRRRLPQGAGDAV